MCHPRLKRGATASTVSHESAPGAQGYQAFQDAASRAGDFMIMARNRCYLPRTGHDHEIPGLLAGDAAPCWASTIRRVARAGSGGPGTPSTRISSMSLVAEWLVTTMALGA